MDNIGGFSNRAKKNLKWGKTMYRHSFIDTWIIERAGAVYGEDGIK